MSDKLNGTLMIGGFAADNTGRKVFDLKITNTWPILSIDRNHPQFVQDDQGLLKQLETTNQHLSIPPDLNIHLSPTRNFLHLNLVNAEGDLMIDFIYLLGWFSYPIEFYRQPKGRWHGAELFFLTPDKHFTSKTGIFVELFAHKNENALHKILSEPFINKTMRCISNHEANAVRTYFLKQLIRHKNPRVVPKFFLSLRYGFWECQDNKSLIVIKRK